jgi:hypothetical protein
MPVVVPARPAYDRPRCSFCGFLSLRQPGPADMIPLRLACGVPANRLQSGPHLSMPGGLDPAQHNLNLRYGQLRAGRAISTAGLSQGWTSTSTAAVHNPPPPYSSTSDLRAVHMQHIRSFDHSYTHQLRSSRHSSRPAGLRNSAAACYKFPTAAKKKHSNKQQDHQIIPCIIDTYTPGLLKCFRHKLCSSNSHSSSPATSHHTAQGCLSICMGLDMQGSSQHSSPAPSLHIPLLLLHPFYTPSPADVC